MIKKSYINIVLLFFIFSSFRLVSEDKPKWDVNSPPSSGILNSLDFSITEGTWMNLDVSPDGSKIVFDLLGDIYIMNSKGEEAKALRRGLAWDVQPRFSPDGKYISFTSDAGGGDNIWVMTVDGLDYRQVTKEDFRLLNNAVWTPDGQYLIARKHFTSERSAGAGELWMYHISGGGGVQLTKRKNDQQDCGEPWVSPDGKYIYFSEDMYPGGNFQYNKDPNKQIYIIRRYDIQKGEIENIVTGPGGAVRPVTNHKGDKLAFVRRVREKTMLFIHDLKTGEEYPIYNSLSKDQQEAWALFGVYPNFNFTPDDKNIIIWSEGHIMKIDIASGDASEIFFRCHVTQKIYEALKFQQKVYEDEFQVKAIRNTITSPDQKYILFNAVGHLWKKTLPDGTPERLTKSDDLEFEPSFSPDGKHILYVTWNDENMGEIRKMDLNTKASTKITTEKGIYRYPSYSPDGKTILYYKEPGNDQQGGAFCNDPGIYTMNANGGDMKLVSKEGEYPQFDKTGERIYYQTGGYLFGSLDKGFHSVNLLGNDKKTHFTSKYANRFVVSPDNKWIAFNELHKVYVAAMPFAGKSIDLSANTNSFPVSLVSKLAGINIHWTADSKKICWTLGDEYYSSELTKRFKFLNTNSIDSLPPLDTAGIKINLKLKMDKPSSKIAFTNAKIITMKEKEIIGNGTVFVEDNIIKYVGPSSGINLPNDAKIYDCSNKVIMPGIIDVHAHGGNFRYGLNTQKQWQYYANLAYGVTTMHDPSAVSEMVFSHSEMIKSGEMVGPRSYSTGTILYGADGDFKAVINNLDDALSALKRTKAFGAFSVKSYNQPRREQRQQIIEAARQLNMMVMPEGGSHFLHNMTMIADGHTGIEHNIPVAPLYDDVIKFWTNSRTAYTPTLIVAYGAESGEDFWYQKTNVWEEKKLLKYTPRNVIDARSRHRTMIPDEEYNNGHILVSKSCKKLLEYGTKVNLGAHGQLNGLGAHWELWMLQQGGMTNLDALKCATINGASYLGMDKEIGSIEEGKLADLIVLDKDPLDDIRNSNSVRYTMINGRLFDTETMNEIGGTTKKVRGKFWFENPKFTNYGFHENQQEEEFEKCSCGH